MWVGGHLRLLSWEGWKMSLGRGKCQVSVGGWTGYWWGRLRLSLAWAPLTSCIGNTSQVPHQSINPGFLCPLVWGLCDGLGAGTTYQRIETQLVNADSHQPIWELSPAAAGVFRWAEGLCVKHQQCPLQLLSANLRTDPVTFRNCKNTQVFLSRS